MAFRRLVRRSGLPHIRLHDLRHTHATQLLIQGVNVKVVSERLGHASVAITLDIYAHTLPTMQEDAVAAFDADLRRALAAAAPSPALASI
jgi:integrase